MMRSASLLQTALMYLAFRLMPTCLTLLHLMQWMAFFDTDEVNFFYCEHHTSPCLQRMAPCNCMCVGAADACQTLVEVGTEGVYLDCTRVLQFLVIRDKEHHSSLPSFLESFEEYGALVVNWKVGLPLTSGRLSCVS